MTIKPIIIIVLFFVACKSNVEKIKPSVQPITESIYASGIVKSKNQYQAFATVNGIIETVYLSEGDSVKKGTPILTVSNELQRLNKENAELAANFSDINANQGKLNDARLIIELARNKMKNDSALYFKQKALWQQQVGTEVELDQRELAYQNSKTNYYSTLIKLNDLKRQLDFTASQSRKNLLISGKLEKDYTLKSEIDGIIYRMYKLKGDMVNIQTPLAVIGDGSSFILEMQVDEYDITRIKTGLSVMVTLDSYKGKVFEAKITRITPYMNERSKTFLVEAAFTKPPAILYPNTTIEANIILQTKNNALLIPRVYLINDSMVMKSNGEKVTVKTGLKDYQKIEIISGIGIEDELIMPVE